MEKTYTTKEAIELLRQGKKLRWKHDSSDHYISEVKENSYCFTVTTEQGSSTHYLYDDNIKDYLWIEYKEESPNPKSSPMKYDTLSEVFEALLAGKKIRKNKWDYFIYISMDENSCIRFTDGSPFTGNFVERGVYWEEYVEQKEVSFDDFKVGETYKTYKSPMGKKLEKAYEIKVCIKYKNIAIVEPVDCFENKPFIIVHTKYDGDNLNCLFTDNTAFYK